MLRIPAVPVSSDPASCRGAGDWLLPPQELAWLHAPRKKADAFPKSLGVELPAPPRIACRRFGRDEAFSTQAQACL
ncbi:MAG: hypothetical protein HXY18_00020 [Bryobacteraceae bacterium]|nr:hypothetical protein [Bryobacteraceae bacterium]